MQYGLKSWGFDSQLQLFNCPLAKHLALRVYFFLSFLQRLALQLVDICKWLWIKPWAKYIKTKGSKSGWYLVDTFIQSDADAQVQVQEPAGCQWGGVGEHYCLSTTCGKQGRDSVIERTERERAHVEYLPCVLITFMSPDGENSRERTLLAKCQTHVWLYKPLSSG